MYEYGATLGRVKDGDTIEVMLDQGLREFREMAIRFYGINAPELSKADQHVAAVAAMNYLVGLGLSVGQKLVIRTAKDRDDKFGGRWEGTVWLASDGAFDPLDFHFVPAQPSLNDRMVAAGHAVPYFGGKR